MKKSNIDCFFNYSRLYVISLWNLDLFPEKNWIRWILVKARVHPATQNII